MPDKNVNEIDAIISTPGLISHIWMLFISAMAGLVAHIERMQSGSTKGFLIIMFVYDMITSALMGLIALYACMSQGLDIYYTGVVIAVFAHSGTKGLGLLTKLAAGKLKVEVQVRSEDTAK